VEGMKRYYGKWFVFDIETTGFHADTSLLLAIGLKNKEEEKIFFVERPSFEKIVLKQFLRFLEARQVECLIGYNILSFDIPYLRAKFLLNNLNVWSLEKLEFIDLFEFMKKLRLGSLKLAYISKLLFNSPNSSSFQMPTFYLKYMEDEQFKKKIIEHLKNDLKNTMLLAFRLGIIS